MPSSIGQNFVENNRWLVSVAFVQTIYIECRLYISEREGESRKCSQAHAKIKNIMMLVGPVYINAVTELQ